MERRSLLKSLLAAPLAALFGTPKALAVEHGLLKVDIGPNNLRPVPEPSERPYGPSPVSAVAKQYAELQRQLEALPSVGAGNTFTTNDDVKFYGECRPNEEWQRVLDTTIRNYGFRFPANHRVVRVVRNTSAASLSAGRPSATWKVNYKRQA